MKVLVVSSYPPRHCGIGAYARDQVDRLRGDGHQVTVMSPTDGDGDLRTSFLGGRAFILAATRGGRFDRIIVHFQPGLYYRPRRPLSKVATSAALLTLALTRGRNLEVVLHEADEPIRWRPDYALLGAALRRAGRVSFHTRAEWEAFERAYGVRVRGAVISHMVGVTRPGSRTEARAALGIDQDGGPMFVCAGFLQRSKGFDRALDAFAAGHAEGARLYVVGSVRTGTEENSAYSDTLERRGGEIEGVKVVRAFLDDAEFDRWVAAADWIVLPYRRAWSSGVLARAHALGTRAIVADVGGLAEQAAEGDVVFRDEDELRAAMSGAGAADHGRKPA